MRGTGTRSDDDPQKAAESIADEVSKLVDGEPLPQGGSITVTWAEEVYQPIQYNGFRVGPLSVTAPILPGETIAQAHDRIWRQLEQLAREQYERKLRGWSDRLKEAGQYVRDSRA